MDALDKSIFDSVMAEKMALVAENARLREALNAVLVFVAARPYPHLLDTQWLLLEPILKQARAALAEKETP